jgi:hypothetical protein
VSSVVRVRAGRVFQHLLGLLIYNIIYSMKSINNIGKKRGRGRPATDATPVLVRLQPSQLKAIDGWAAKQVPPATRPEAIRGMIDAMLHILAKDPGEAPKAAKRAARASEMAAQTIERKLDPSVPPEERAQRRRRLTKGPPEFRVHRVDLPRAKGK